MIFMIMKDNEDVMVMKMMMMMMTRCDGTVVVVQIVMGVPSTANRALP